METSLSSDESVDAALIGPLGPRSDDDYATPVVISEKSSKASSGRLSYAIFVLLGVGVLLPWNAFIMAIDYFLVIYQDKEFAFIMTLAYNYFGVAFLLLSIFFASRFSFNLRMHLFLLLDLLCLLIVPISAVALSSTPSKYITYLCVGLCGAASAVLSGTTFGLAAIVHFKNITALMVGQGIAGIISSLIRIITKASLPATKDGYLTSGIIFFSISGLIIVMCMIGYYVLDRLPETRAAIARSRTSTESAMLLGAEKATKVNPLVVLKKIWVDTFAVFMVFFVTLTLFPGLTNLITSTHKSLGDWFGVINTSVFIIAEFIGRSMPQYQSLRFGRKYLWLQSLIRLVFFPLLYMSICRVFNSDFYAYVTMFLFALSNGYTSTMAMSVGPELVPQKEKEMAGIIMSFFLNFSILLAAHFGLLLSKVTPTYNDTPDVITQMSSSFYSSSFYSSSS
eukprot:TRINITY_DN13928_c0_g1_i1.p2 TRINITY_DN13928_c0_g1~~TRINITY_DN13928_c0_g1_i1.p2  ORF type:complete len:464 (-),score=124.90 TRINITY_DN13928_c0_g1_i1:1527-2882(-)